MPANETPALPRSGMTADGPTLAFTGGGTGGHIYPGLAVVEALGSMGFRGRIVWIGSESGRDRSMVEAAGIEFKAVPSGKFRREFSARNIADLFRIAEGYRASRSILREIGPALLFSKGGYVSVPPCRAARSLGIPTITHESDVTPGLATRLNAASADLVLVSYEKTAGFFSRGTRAKVVVSGNPVRAAFRTADPSLGRRLFSIPGGVPVVLILGGSQGSAQVNRIVRAISGRLENVCFTIHQTGSADAAQAVGQARTATVAYIGDELPHVLAAADLVVGRAGAGTLWECAALGKPMVLVPLCGRGTRGDQVENASLFAEAGAAVSLVGDAAGPDTVFEAIDGFLREPERRRRAGDAARRLAGMDAAPKIARIILEHTGASS